MNECLKNMVKKILPKTTKKLLLFYGKNHKMWLADHYFFGAFKRHIDWDNPKDLNEKINWLKFHEDPYLWASLADKYKVREYISSRNLKEILVPIYGKWNKAIDTLIKHLNMKKATWKDERCASMRFISRSYKNLKRYEEAKLWINKAIDEAPYLRDPYVEKALLDYELNNFEEVIKNCLKALTIKKNTKSYINEPFSFDHTIYDLLSISFYNVGLYEEALFYSNKAILISPNDERLINNNKIIKEKLIN